MSLPESLYLIQIKRNIKYEDIIILVPFEFENFFTRYVHEVNFISELPKQILKYKGVNIQYISPENACYVYLKDFIFYENKEGIWFKLDLNNNI